MLGAHMGCLFWYSPDPRQGPESPFPEREGFGVQKPPFPLVLEKGVFCEKIPMPGNGDSGPCLGSGASQNKLVQLLEEWVLISLKLSGSSGVCLVVLIR